MPPLLTVLLVNYNRADDTIACVESLRQSTFHDFEIIIVDNASHDGSADILAARCPDVTLLRNGVNVGFAEGNNTGIRLALERERKYILLLNNDTVVDPRALEMLIGTMESHPYPGVAGGKIYYYNRNNVLWFAGGYFNPDSALGGHYGIAEVDAGQFNAATTSDFITGCCLLFRREVCDAIGLLDGSYFAYLEDADFCVRARRAGFPVMYQPAAVIYHKVSTTSSWDSPLYLYFNLRNKILFLRKNSSPRRWIPHLPELLYFYVRQFMRLLLKRHDRLKRRAAWWGLVDGIGNFTGTNGEGRLPLLTDSAGQPR